MRVFLPPLQLVIPALKQCQRKKKKTRGKQKLSKNMHKFAQIINPDVQEISPLRLLIDHSMYYSCGFVKWKIIQMQFFCVL